MNAREENILTLRHLLKLESEEASQVLDAFILVSDEANNLPFRKNLRIVLQKTFDRIDFEKEPGRHYNCEIIIESSKGRTKGPYVYVGSSREGMLIISRIKSLERFPANLNPFYFFLMSCYVGGSVLKAMLGNRVKFPADDEIILNLVVLLPKPEVFVREINLGEAYLAGGGAIGNSLLYALQFFKLQGLLHITDPDHVSSGNLNRCLFFTGDDINEKKAKALARHAQPLLPGLILDPLDVELSKVPAAKEGGAWLERLIVAVDSRRSRRNLQGEIPHEVFDASTTGIAEVVTHYNKQPVNGKACLGCIYYKEEEEEAHEKHVADALGISIEQVNSLYIDEEAEIQIKNKYPKLTNSLVGIPYDTLFKQLCGEGKLETISDKQVLAPLAFVSALAGALLALTIVENILNLGTYNYWRLSPWNSPNSRLKQGLEKSTNCEFCNRNIITKTAEEFWSE